MVIHLHNSHINLNGSHFAQLVENSPLITVFYDKEGFIFRVNRAWQDFFKMSPKTVIGIYNIHKDPLFHKWGLKKYWDIIQDGSRIVTHDFEYDPKEAGLPGEKVWLKGHFGSVKDEKDEILFFYIQLEEVSQRKKLEEIVIQNQKWDTLQNFSGGIAHDLNNILTAFSGSLSLIKDAYFEELIRKYDDFTELFENMEIGVKNATQLANQLLIFSKGNLPLKKFINLSQIITESIGFISHGKKVQISINCSDELWYIFADSAQISQIFQNLALNSIQAMEDTGKIEITSRNHILENDNKFGLNPGEYIKTVFCDDGPGISSENHPKIFNMYFTTKKSGFGLGLSVVHSIVQRHHGHLEFLPNKSQGATAILLLPADSNAKIATITQQTSFTKFSGKILILDDDPNIRIVLKRMCSFLELQATICSTSEEAINSYQKASQSNSPFDLVLTDLTLKQDVDGRKVFEEIRALDKNARGIIMSGYSDSDIMANYVNYGFLNRLRKPFTLTEFKLCITPIFSKK